MVGYTWTEENGVSIEEGGVLDDTWIKGTIELFDEYMIENKNNLLKKKTTNLETKMSRNQ